MWLSLKLLQTESKPLYIRAVAGNCARHLVFFRRVRNGKVEDGMWGSIGFKPSRSRLDDRSREAFTEARLIVSKKNCCLEEEGDERESHLLPITHEVILDRLVMMA